MGKAKPFSIAKKEVWQAYKRVRSNQGSAGVAGQSTWTLKASLITLTMSC